MIDIGVVGCGYWGPNIVRNFSKKANCNVRWICDLDENKLKKIGKTYSSSRTTKDFNTVLRDKKTKAVVIATPFYSHYSLAKKALLAGKHVMVEKPFVDTSEKAEELIQIAKKMGVILMVGFTFVYSPAVQRIKKIIDSGELGSIYYIHSTRVNLGIFRYHQSVLWDLASHDFSVMFYWFGGKPHSVLSVQRDCLKRGTADTAHITINFKSGPIIYVLVSWLSPIKMRNMIIAGSKKMIFFNDERQAEKIKIFDKGSQILFTSPSGEDSFNYKPGAVFSPAVDTYEPLEAEVDHFLECIAKGKRPITDGESGLKVVKAIENAETFDFIAK